MFTPLDVTTNMDAQPWTDIDRNTLLHGTIDRIGLLPNGTTGGRASIAIAVTLDDGRVVIAETTWRLFDAAARALGRTQPRYRGVDD
jgi:hypothetical protein